MVNERVHIVITRTLIDAIPNVSFFEAFVSAITTIIKVADLFGRREFIIPNLG